MDPRHETSDGRSGTLPRPDAGDHVLDLASWERYLSTYDQHGPHLYRLALLLLGNDPGRAEAAVFEVFMAAHAPWRDGRIEDLGANLRSGLTHRVTVSPRHHVASNLFSRRHRPDGRDGRAWSGGPRNEHNLSAALGDLTPEVRAAAALRYYEGLSLAETASLLGDSEAAVRADLRLALQTSLASMQTEPPGRGDDTAGGEIDPDPVDEARLVVTLRDHLDDIHPSPELRDRLRAALDATTPRRASVPIVPIAAALLIAIVAVSVLVSHQNGGVDLITEPSTADVAVDPTTTGVPPTSTSSTVTSTSTATTVPAPATTPAGPAVTCRDSTDAACGPFRWDPEPTNQPATLTARLPDGPIVVGRDYELTLEMSDPDGPVDLGCYSVDADRPALSLGACTQEAAPACPDRFGPWTPPAGQQGSASSVTVIQFQRTGAYVVEVQVVRPDGCDNVDPYRSGAQTSLAVDVVESAG